MAAIRPMTSLTLGPDSAVAAGPPNSTWAPVSAISSAAAWAASTEAGGMSLAVWSNTTVTMVVVPSSDTMAPGP